jgi:hypothetical protein
MHMLFIAELYNPRGEFELSITEGGPSDNPKPAYERMLDRMLTVMPGKLNGNYTWKITHTLVE